MKRNSMGLIFGLVLASTAAHAGDLGDLSEATCKSRMQIRTVVDHELVSVGDKPVVAQMSTGDFLSPNKDGICLAIGQYVGTATLGINAINNYQNTFGAETRKQAADYLNLLTAVSGFCEDLPKGTLTGDLKGRRGNRDDLSENISLIYLSSLGLGLSLAGDVTRDALASGTQDPCF